MATKRKVWVLPFGDPVTKSEDYPVPELDPEEARRRLGLSEDERGRQEVLSMPPRAQKLEEPLESRKAPKSRKTSKEAAPRRKARRYAIRWNPWLSLALTYLVGPLSLLLRMGEARTWQLTALGCGIITAAAAWFRPGLIEALIRGPWAVLIFGVGLGLVTLLNFSAWSRAVLLAGRDVYANPKSLPEWIYTPASIGLAGLVVPGSGLLLAGHVKRAAAALWAPLLVIVSGLILAASPEVWNLYQQSQGSGASNSVLESFFLFAVATGIIGLLLWLVQALDGLRVALAWRSQKEPARRSDWVGAALLASMVALIVTASPPDLARNLDELAVSSQEAGFRVIPLGLGQVAMRLDPSRPVYAMHVAGLYRELGQHQAANDLMRELRTHWLPYEQMMARGDMFSGIPGETFDMFGSPANGIPFQPANLD